MEMQRSIIICSLIVFDGFLHAHSWNIDSNRLQVLRTGPDIHSDHETKSGNYKRSDQLTRAADYYNQQRSTRHSANSYYNQNSIRTTPRRPAPPRSKYRNNGKIYKPLEDPSIFYRNNRGRPDIPQNAMNGSQNDGSYRDQNSKMVIQQRGSVILPSRGVNAIVRPNVTTTFRRHPSQRGSNFGNDLATSESNNEIRYSKQYLCVKCPAERTVVAKKGRNKVLLETPELRNCRGGLLPNTVHFKRLYGPRFGSLLQAGSHITVAQVVYNNQSQQLCQYRVNVIVQSCQPVEIPSDLLKHCPQGSAWGAKCFFRCLRHNSKLSGDQTITCQNDLTWSAEPPSCESTEWCDPPTAPNYGRLDCSSPEYNEDNEISKNTTRNNAFPEGTVCKAQCDSRFLARPRIAKCIQGSWTSVPFCMRRPQRRRLGRPRRPRYSSHLASIYNKHNYSRLQNRRTLH